VVVRELFGDITADYLQSVTPVALTFALQTDDATA
jgi:3-oxoadipate CoA-transferase beta subunit